MPNRYDRHEPVVVADSLADGRDDASLADVTQLIDYLDELVLSGKKLKLYSGRVLVDVEDYLAIVDRLRLALPNEMRQARRVVQERQQILLDAQAEAEKILSVAKARVEYLIGDMGLTAEARFRGEDILRRSRDESKSVVAQVDRYAMEVFDNAEKALRDGLSRIADAKEAMARPR